MYFKKRIDIDLNNNLISALFFGTYLFLMICSNTPELNASQFTPETEDSSWNNNFENLPSDALADSIQTNEKNLSNLLKIGAYNAVITKIESLPNEEQRISYNIAIKTAAYIGMEDYSSGMKEFEMLKKNRDSSANYFSIIADIFLKKKKFFPAMQVCQNGLMRHFDSVKLLYQMGTAYDLAGKRDVALVYYKAASNTNRKSKELNQDIIEQAIAALYYNINDFKSAEQIISKLVDRNWNPGFQLIVNAGAYASKGEFKKAISILEKVKEGDTQFLKALLMKAQYLLVDDRPDSALSLLSDWGLLLRNSNLSDTVNLLNSLGFLLNNNLEAALNELNEIKYPEKIKNFQLIKAITHISAGNTKQSIEGLNEAPFPYKMLSTLPGFEKYLGQHSIGPKLALVFFCYDLNLFDQAVIIAKRAQDKYDDNILLNFMLAECYLKLNRYSMALEELRIVNDVFKKSYAIQFYLAEAYTKAGMVEEASIMFKSLIEERPDFIMANLVYGKFLSDQTKWSEAKNVYEQGLNFTPDSTHLQLSLGWILAQLNELDSLMELLQIIKKNKKHQPHLLHHLEGWNAFRNNDYLKAEGILLTAIEEAPGDPEVSFHLGMALMEIGKKEMAENLFRQSLLFEKQMGKYQVIINNLID